MRTFTSLDELRAATGEHLGYSDWHLIDQARVNAFADATDDHQWIHVDVDRARRESPFGGPVAHGYLTLSLLPWLTAEILSVSGVTMGVNYGLNRVRFPAPVLVGSRVRAGAQLTSLEDVPGGVQLVTTVTIEVEGQTKPACVAESVARFYA
ncbi:MAG TPA: MaoC family dehydratase [Candidatus Dormibacteraeota bacterium]